MALLATGLVAILFQPLAQRLQRGVNQLMYGERDTEVVGEATSGEEAISLAAELSPDVILMD